jgi:hypothetical protein
MDAKDAWKLVLSIGVTIALILHALLPRYEWRTVGDSGMVIVVYDRWANYFPARGLRRQGQSHADGAVQAILKSRVRDSLR